MKKLLLKVWDSIDDFVLEVGRTALIGAYGAVLPVILAKVELIKEGDWQIAALIIAMILKGLDRWMHEKGLAEKGITRF